MSVAQYTFSAPGTNIPTVRVLRGDGGPKISGGLAKWEVVDRPKRKGVTQYVGLDPLRLDVPILFDGWKIGLPIRGDMNSLMLMQREVQGEPPKVKINLGVAGGLPIWVQSTSFVIEGVDWGDDQIWEKFSGQLVLFRQDAVVHLLEHIATTELSVGASGSGIGPARGIGGTPQGAKHRRHRVKTGEDLPIIAVKEYGNRAKWKIIAQANNIKDPRHVTVGQVLRLP